MAVASTVSEGTLPECGLIDGVVCADNSSELDDLHDQLLSTSIPHPRKGLGSQSP